MTDLVPAVSTGGPAGRRRPVALPGTARRFAGGWSSRVGLALLGSVGGLAVLAGVLTENPTPFYPAGPALLEPSRAHLFGTDQVGRDVLSCVAHGARTSLAMVLAVAAISGVVGITVGAVAGYAGGAVDSVVMRGAEVVQSVPRFFLATLAVAAMGTSPRVLTLALGLTSWTLLARVVRSETQALRGREYVEAARAVGASPGRILARHVVPNVAGSALVVVALVGSRVVLLEAGMAFLGLTDPDTMSWGLLIRNAEPYLRVAWWMSVFPGAALVAAGLGLNLVSDGLAEALGPGSPASTTIGSAP